MVWLVVAAAVAVAFGEEKQRKPGGSDDGRRQLARVLVPFLFSEFHSPNNAFRSSRPPAGPLHKDSAVKYVIFFKRNTQRRPRAAGNFCLPLVFRGWVSGMLVRGDGLECGMYREGLASKS